MIKDTNIKITFNNKIRVKEFNLSLSYFESLNVRMNNGIINLIFG